MSFVLNSISKYLYNIYNEHTKDSFFSIALFIGDRILDLCIFVCLVPSTTIVSLEIWTILGFLLL